MTLAHCLHYANIPHIDLEKTSDPAPQVGAPIGIMPDRARILDQLGRWKKIEYGLEPLARPILIYPGAFQVESSYPKVMRKRFVQYSGRGKAEIWIEEYLGSSTPLHSSIDKEFYKFSMKDILVPKGSGFEKKKDLLRALTMGLQSLRLMEKSIKGIFLLEQMVCIVV